MKNLQNLSAFLGLLSCLFFSQAAIAQTNFYYSPDGKTELEVSKEKILVKFAKATSFEQQKQILSKFQKIGNLKKEMMLPRPILSIIPLEGITQTTEVAALLKLLKEHTQILYANAFLKHKDGTLHGIQEHILIRLKSEKDRPMFNQTMKEFNLQIDGQNEFDSLLFHVSVLPESQLNALEWANRLHETERFDYAEPDFLRLMKRMGTNTITDTNDPYEPQQWSLNNDGLNTSTYNGVSGSDMKVTTAWQSFAGHNMKIAIIDEGVDLTHPDLAANMLAGYDATGQGSGGAMQGNDSHGTGCAGIAAAVANNNIGVAGVAFNAKIVPVRIAYHQAGDKHWTTTNSWIGNGINWAWQTGNADVLSNSWGGGSSSSTINNAIDGAVNSGRSGLGAPVLFSAGNEDQDVVGYPSSYSPVISVIATSMCDERKTPTSCDGEDWWGSNHGTGGDIAAPGVKIYTTDIAGAAGKNSGDYNAAFNGTSSACPNAAGVVAILLSAQPFLTQAEVREALESTCDKTGGYTYYYNLNQPNGTWSEDLGYGRVNAANALNELIRASSNCKVPLDYTAYMDDEDGTKVHLHWDGVFGAVEYTIHLRKVGNTEWKDFTTSNTSLKITNLDPCTNYETQIQTNCQTGSSVFTQTVYFTSEDCN